VKVDARVIAATNQDPVEAMRAERFREDLYYRLNVVTIQLPPLRERREDIPLLIQAFVEEFSAKYDKRIVSVDEAARQTLTAQTWPGTIRELRNTIERAAIVCDGELIRPEHLPVPVATPPRAGARDVDLGNAVVFDVGTSLDEVEKAMILRTLAANGN